MWEVLTGACPFDGSSNPVQLCRDIAAGQRPVLPPDCPADIRDLLQRCWSEQPELRPTAASMMKSLFAR